MRPRSIFRDFADYVFLVETPAGEDLGSVSLNDLAPLFSIINKNCFNVWEFSYIDRQINGRCIFYKLH